VEKTGEKRYIVSKNSKKLEIEETSLMDYSAFLETFNALHENGNFGGEGRFDVGHDDLYPNIGMKPHDFKQRDHRPRGMLAGEDDPIFGERQIRRESSTDSDVPPMARYDPYLPTKNKKKGKGPDPDHFKKPGDGDSDLF
jgi:hypothetical protein